MRYSCTHSFYRFPDLPKLHYTIPESYRNRSLACRFESLAQKKILINHNVLIYPNGTFQDEIKSAIRQIVEIIKKPLLAIRSSITRIKANLAIIINKMKKGMLAVKNTVIQLGEGV